MAINSFFHSFKVVNVVAIIQSDRPTSQPCTNALAPVRSIIAKNISFFYLETTNSTIYEEEAESCYLVIEIRTCMYLYE